MNETIWRIFDSLGKGAGFIDRTDYIKLFKKRYPLPEKSTIFPRSSVGTAWRSPKESCKP